MSEKYIVDLKDNQNKIDEFIHYLKESGLNASLRPNFKIKINGSKSSINDIWKLVGYGSLHFN